MNSVDNKQCPECDNCGTDGEPTDRRVTVDSLDLFFCDRFCAARYRKEVCE